MKFFKNGEQQIVDFMLYQDFSADSQILDTFKIPADGINVVPCQFVLHVSLSPVRKFAPEILSAGRISCSSFWPLGALPLFSCPFI